MRDSVRDPMAGHAARLLVLIDVFSDRPKARIDTLGKLARLDFLLRYPVVLEQLVGERRLPPAARPSASERRALESAMIRWKYGPWDHRYYTLVGRLLAQQLIYPLHRERPLAVRITEGGRQAAKGLTGASWDRVRIRATALRSHADVSAAQLGRRVAPLLADTDLGLPLELTGVHARATA